MPTLEENSLSMEYISALPRYQASFTHIVSSHLFLTKQCKVGTVIITPILQVTN